MSARLYGAGRRQEAVRYGVQATWLAIAIGIAVVAVLQLIARPAAEFIGDDPVQIESAVSWLRIASCGAPFILISFAGQGWMRGVQDVRRPLVYLLGAMALSAVLCPLLVFPLGLGLEGSAIANVVSQAISAALFLRALHRERVGWGRDWPIMRAQLATARDLGVRTAPSRSPTSLPPPSPPGWAPPTSPRTRSRCSCGRSWRSSWTASRSPRSS